MVTVYMLGLNPVAAFPIMMGACTFSVPVGSVQFIKLDDYSRKITLFTATFGVPRGFGCRLLGKVFKYLHVEVAGGHRFVIQRLHNAGYPEKASHR